VSISETITIDAGPAIAQLDEVAAAADRAAEAMARLGKGGSFGAGAEKLAASMAAAADRIEAASTRAAAAMGRMSTAARAATGGIDSLGASADAAAAGEDRLAASTDAAAAAMDRQAMAGGRATRATAEAGAAHEKFWKGVKVLAVGGAVAAVYGIDKAMKLQTEVTRLYTAAGLKGVKPGDVTAATLAIGSKTGFSGQTIAEAMYHPVSAGLDWKTTKTLTEQSANLANIHGANIEDTTYALSSMMKAYNQSAKDVIPTAALLNSIVGQGDMRFQDFNESVKNWAPTGASMGISMQSMGAGLAYLTDRGNSAEVASTRMTMGLSMATAGSKAANVYLRDLGLTTGTLDLKNKSLQATMEKGGLTTNKFAADLKKPDGLYVALNDMQQAFHKAGLSAGQSDQVMAKIFGGGRSDKAIVSLMQNLEGVRQKYEQIGQGVHDYGKSVATEQATAQQKWKDFLATGQNLATGFGNALLPMFTKIAGLGASLLQGHGGAVGGVLGGAAALFTGKKLVSGVGSAVKTGESALRGVGKIAETLHIPGLDKLAGIGKNTGAAALDGSAARLSAAAAALDGAAEKLAGGSALGGPGGAAGKAGRAAEGAAAAGTAGETVGLSASMLAAPLLGAGAGLALGLYLDKYKKYDGPAVPGQQGPRAYESRSDAWRQYDAPPKPAAPTAFTNTLAQAMGKPVKMPPPDISALTAAKGKAAADAKALAQSVEAALKKPAKAAKPDISAYRAAIGPARTDGAAVSAGFAGGIRAGMGAAVAAAGAVASAAAAAMGHAVQARSPSKVTEKIGKDTAAGFVVGLEGGKSAVDAAATALGKNAAKAADIASIDATAKKMLAEVPKGDTGLTKLLRADQSKLIQLANQRSRLEQEITDAGQITKNMISGASIMGAMGYTPAMAAAGGPQSSAGMITGMQSQAGDLKAFAKQVAQLKKMGLNATSLDQIIQAGPAQGLPVAQGLTSGGKGAIGQVNQLEKQIQGASRSIGSTGGTAMYQAGVDAAQGLAAGIRSQLGSVVAAIGHLAKAMVAAMKKATKSHSPSLVFAEIGRGFPEGLALGVDAGSAVAEASVRRMGQRAVAAFPAGHPGSSGHGGGGQVSHVTNVYVQGHVMAEHDLVNVVQEHVLTRANNNWQTGWRLPGRAA
jgi:TP901 family phage tail tape measure protein